MLIETKRKMRSYLPGAVLNASFNIMKPCQSIIVIVENSKILNTKEILNLILVDKFVGEKEAHIVLILVLNSVIRESVNPVNTKELLLLVSVEKVQELWNVVKKGKYSNVVKNVKEFSTVPNINVKEIATTEIVYPVRKNIW